MAVAVDTQAVPKLIVHWTHCAQVAYFAPQLYNGLLCKLRTQVVAVQGGRVRRAVQDEVRTTLAFSSNASSVDDYHGHDDDDNDDFLGFELYRAR